MSCPICARSSDAKYRPFCSRRCADVDLGRWLAESYKVPAEATNEDDDGPAFPSAPLPPKAPPRQ